MQAAIEAAVDAEEQPILMQLLRPASQKPNGFIQRNLSASLY